MIDKPSTEWDDTVLPFQLERSDIRGRVARLDHTLDQILAQHTYPLAVETLLAQTALLTVMIGQMIDLRWKLSVQVRGDGPIRILACDYFGPPEAGAPARLRAYASFDRATLDMHADPFGQIGKGYFAILIDQGKGTAPYEGVTPLGKGSLAACAETYFEQSEQLLTHFKLSIGHSHLADGQKGWRAGGVMLQQMPKPAPTLPGIQHGAQGAGENWVRVNTLLDTADDLELVGPTVSPPQLLRRLFHEESPRVFDPQPVKFGCTCSSDRVRQSLSIYSAKDIGTMTDEQGKVTADCQFCGAHYEFDPDTLGFKGDIPPGGASDGDG